MTGQWFPGLLELFCTSNHGDEVFAEILFYETDLVVGGFVFSGLKAAAGASSWICGTCLIHK